MSELRIELPPDVRAQVTRRAVLAELEHLEARAARGSREAFERVLAKAPATDPAPGDEW